MKIFQNIPPLYFEKEQKQRTKKEEKQKTKQSKSTQIHPKIVLEVVNFIKRNPDL
jgi:hypothetical protein